MIVRLKATFENNKCKHFIRFNSMIVRLKAEKTGMLVKFLKGFNSMIVRLKAIVPMNRRPRSNGFQFYDSPIKSFDYVSPCTYTE